MDIDKMLTTRVGIKQCSCWRNVQARDQDRQRSDLRCVTGYSGYSGNSTSSGPLLLTPMFQIDKTFSTLGHFQCIITYNIRFINCKV